MADQLLHGRKIAILLARADTEQAEVAEPRKALIDAGADIEVISAQAMPWRFSHLRRDPGTVTRRPGRMTRRGSCGAS